MKKIIFTASCVATLVSSTAMAKTEGNYLGFDIVRSQSQVINNSDLASDQENYSQYYQQKKVKSFYGAGISYRYAFNFNKFFIAPGISYSYLNNKEKAGYAGDSEADPYSQSMKLKSQVTFQTNFGYDVGDKLAVYIPAGISSFNYTLQSGDSRGGATSVDTQKTGNKTALFLGFGTAVQVAENWLMNLEYDRYQTMRVNLASATVDGGQISTKTNVSLVKIGLAYKF